MNLIPTAIPDVVILEPRVFGDQRGFFMETYRAEVFASAGLPTNFVQDNHSGSQRGTLRGLHYQICHPQGKLLRVIAGEMYDVVVDLRRTSPTFGKWIGTMLSAENKRQIWVPEGFAHGFYVVSEWVELTYKVTDYYAAECERSLLWNDAQLGIDWPLVDGQPPILSARDAKGTPFQEAELFD